MTLLEMAIVSTPAVFVRDLGEGAAHIDTRWQSPWTYALHMKATEARKWATAAELRKAVHAHCRSRFDGRLASLIWNHETLTIELVRRRWEEHTTRILPRSSAERVATELHRLAVRALEELAEAGLLLEAPNERRRLSEDEERRARRDWRTRVAAAPGLLELWSLRKELEAIKAFSREPRGHGRRRSWIGAVLDAPIADVEGRSVRLTNRELAIISILAGDFPDVPEEAWKRDGISVDAVVKNEARAMRLARERHGEFTTIYGPVREIKVGRRRSSGRTARRNTEEV